MTSPAAGDTPTPGYDVRLRWESTADGRRCRGHAVDAAGRVLAGTEDVVGLPAETGGDFVTITGATATALIETSVREAVARRVLELYPELAGL